MLAINIPADGLFLAVQHYADGDYSSENCERIISEYVGRFLEAEPDIILLNVCYRRSLTPSEVADSYLYDIETDENGAPLQREGRSIKKISPVTNYVTKYFMSFILCGRELLKNGIDLYRFAINRIRQTKCRVFFSVRMNDGHFTKDPAINSGFALKNNGEYTIDKDGKYLDFSKEAVQNYYYSYIEELLQNYQVDGIELDWLRYPRVLPKEKCSDYHILHQYMKKIRALTAKADGSVGLAVRMLPTEGENLSQGFDVCAWIAEGLVDVLTVENFYIPTNYEIPVAEWRSSIEKRNTAGHDCRLLCGSDWAVSCVERYSIAMTPALVRGFSEECLANGADGVYLFNFFEDNDTNSLAFVRDADNAAHLENCFVERMKAAKSPRELPRRYVHIGNSNARYPISLGRGEKYCWNKTLRRPAETCRLVIGCDKEEPLSVYVNGHAVDSVQKEPVCPGFSYIPPEELGKGNEFIYAVTQAAPFVYSRRLPLLSAEAETLKIQIANEHGDTVRLLWIEIVCE